MSNRWWKYTNDHYGIQRMIDDAFRYRDANEGEASDLIDGLLDLCAVYLQGFDYPSSDVEGYEDKDEDE